MTEHTYRTAVMASAGTGKTYSLVENYLYSLFGLDGTGINKRPHEILALTFTEKAAHEMRLRITWQLANLLSDQPQENGLMAVAKDYDRSEVRRILRAMPNAPIATFHAFCASLIRKEARSFGIDERFAILLPRDEWMLARNVLRPIILKEINSGNVALKSMVARFRLKNGGLALGLIDGLLSLYFSLFEKGIDSHDLLPLTSTQNRSVLPRSLHEVKLATDRFLALKTSADTRSRLLAVADHLQSFKQEMGLKDEWQVSRWFLHLRNMVKGNFGDRIARSVLVSSIVSLGGSLVDFYVFDDEMTVAHTLSQFHQQFERVKSEAQKLSYADLLHKTKQALITDQRLRQRVKLGIKHVLVDEYQDTSPLQEDIVALLLENRQREDGITTKGRVIDQVDITDGPSLFVVGDRKQSIYGFRGAEAALLPHMIDKMAKSARGEHGFSRKILQINRRSAPAVIALINLVSRHTLMAQGYDEAESLVAFKQEDRGKCALWVGGESNRADRTIDNLSRAADGVAKILRDRPQVMPKDIVILVRRIKSAGVIQRELARLGVPARVVGGDGFFQQQEVVDILSALKLLTDPSNALALAVVLRSPLVLLLDQEILLVKGSVDQTLSLLRVREALALLSDGSRERLARFLNALDKIKSAVLTDGLVRALDILIDDCDFAHSLGVSDHPFQKWANIEKLSVMFAKDTRNPFVAIDDYYACIADDSREPLAYAQMESNAVSLMTIHQSKGLEFDIVVLADAESSPVENYGDFLVDRKHGVVCRPKGRLIAACGPSDSSERAMAQTRFDRCRKVQRAKETEEASRLLYVALTRAKSELYIVSSYESFFVGAHAGSLIGLFLQAHRTDAASFLQLCHIEHMSEPVLQLAATSKDRPVADAATLSNSKGNVRIFASALKVSSSGKIRDLVDYAVGGQKRHIIIDGNRAHKLIACAGDMLFGGLDRGLPLDRLMDAAFRAQGLVVDDDSLLMKKQVMGTLTLLAREFRSARNAVFEKPLCSWPLPSVMVEGFADLVVEYDDFVGVIELKSSYRLVVDPNTYFQAMAYAHALSQQFDQPVKFAVLLVGNNSHLKWNPYDAHAHAVFIEAVREHHFARA